MMNAITKTSTNPLRALRIKEWTENKPALLVGLIVFVGLPTLWTLLLWSLDTRADILPGFASALWLGAGGLFAAVLGAQVVCRDLGAPTERFLLSRPITQVHVLRTKAWAGFLLLVFLSGLIGGLELFWRMFFSSGRSDAGPMSVFILATGLSLSSYWIALVAACATRRSLTSTLAAAFFLVLLVTVPLIVRIPGIQDISDLIYSEEHVYRNGLFVVVFVLVLALVTAKSLRLFATTDQRIDLGPKTMAWMVGLTLTSLFVLAMREVGATQPLVTTWWEMESPINYSQFAASRHRVAMRESRYEGNVSSLCLFDIDAKGQIKRRRKKDLTEPLLISERAFMIDANGDLVSIGLTRITDPPYIPSDPWKMWLRTFDWEKMSLTSEIELPLPDLTDWWMVSDVCCTDSRVYVLIRGENKVDNSNRITSYTCRIFEYRIGTDAAILESTQSTEFALMPWSADPSWATIQGFSSGESVRVYAGRNSNLQLQPVPRPDPLSAFTVRADRFGLSVLPVRSASPSNPIWSTDSEGVIGRARATPWGALFRSDYPTVIPISSSRLLEIHFFSIIEYDMTQPTNPRRSAHITSPPIRDVIVMDDLMVIHHGPGFSIVRMPSITNQ